MAKKKDCDSTILLHQNEAIINEIVNQEKTAPIYHYTSMEVFLQLLKNINNDCFTFWAGSVYTMNDAQEMILGYEYLKQTLPRVENKLRLKDDEKLFNFFNDTHKNLDIKRKFCNWMINDDVTNFAISFSSASDILPMWSQYGGNGSGVCLHFSPSIIQAYYESNQIEKRVTIEKCVYEKKEILKKMDFELPLIYKSFFENKDNKSKRDPMEKARCLAVMYGITCAYVKHHCFKYEKEIRMNFFSHSEHWKFRDSQNNNCVVYVEVPIPINALIGVSIGPAADMKRVRNPIIMAMRSKGIHLEPTQSMIPFRIY